MSETKIKLKDNEAAVIFGEDSVSMWLPPIDPVPNHVIMATTIGILLKIQDEDFKKYLDRRFEELMQTASDKVTP